MDTQQKLELLSDASQYDLSCSCANSDTERRQRAPGGVWLYPVSLPRGGTSIHMKTLMSNSCTNDCRYCPFRTDQDPRRCTLSPEEVVRLFVDYWRARKVNGLFLSSGVIRDPDYTMDRMTTAARMLRQIHKFRGFIHLKVIPGASDAAIEDSLSVADAVSLNAEVPTESAMAKLSLRKDFQRGIVQSMRKISEWTSPGGRYEKVRQSTQFIVGAAGERDREIVLATYGLYKRLRLTRVYFSAYQRGLGDPSLPGEQVQGNPGDILTREHRLYQVDWLIRKYGFEDREIPFLADGNLSLETDPKEHWARLHPEFFPLDVNRADKLQLLRVPGLGPISVDRILKIRRNGGRIRRMEQIGRLDKRLQKASPFIKIG